jgi:hypothetical protein
MFHSCSRLRDLWWGQPSTPIRAQAACRITYKSYVQSRVGGAAQPNANAKVLAAADILVPPSRVQRDFREVVEPMVDEREVLQFQNQKLKAARDLLLPRLMSGEIAV